MTTYSIPTERPVKHPAPFSLPIIDAIETELYRWGRPELVLDPFAGIGRIFALASSCDIVGAEIQHRWARECLPQMIVVANAKALPFRPGTFDGIVTSPCYGNRFADHHNAKDGSERRSYKHDLGEDPHPDSAATLHWSPAYRRAHRMYWAEILRVCRPGALLIINLSNHIRKDVERLVVEWHLVWFLSHGCQLLDVVPVETSRMRKGAHHRARVHNEFVLVLRAPNPSLAEEGDIYGDHER